MTDPPFPVPPGMQWDPDKKRFFKSDKNPPYQSRSSLHNRKVKVTRNAAQRNHIHQRACFNEYDQYPRSPHLCSHAIVKSAFPTFAVTRMHSMRSNLYLLERMKICHKVTVNTWSTLSLQHHEIGAETLGTHHLGLHAIGTNPKMGSILFVMSRNNTIFFIDTSFNVVGDRTGLFSPSLDWYSKPQDFQISLPLGATHNLYDPALADYTLWQAMGNPVEEKDSIYALDGCWHVRFYDGVHVDLMYLSTDSSSVDVGRIIRKQRLSLTVARERFSVQANEINLSIRAVPEQSKKEHRASVIVVVSHDKFVDYFEISFDPLQEAVVKQYFSHVKSDIICHDIAADGSSVLLGCRNGDLIKSNLALGSYSCIPNKQKSLYLPTTRRRLSGIGALTNIKFVSCDEFIAAFSNGQIQLLSLSDYSHPIMEFFGHVNSWTLHPCMTIDVRLRVIAFAGQDHRVRLWSLDNPYPLQNPLSHDTTTDLSIDVCKLHCREHQWYLNTKPVHPPSIHSIAFSEPVTGLAFCQRRSVSMMEGSQNNRFLPYDTPALAITCGTNDIVFFE